MGYDDYKMAKVKYAVFVALFLGVTGFAGLLRIMSRYTEYTLADVFLEVMINLFLLCSGLAFAYVWYKNRHPDEEE